MEKVFMQAKDKNVAAVKIYKKTADAYAYSDSAKTKKVSAKELEDMFLKGVVIVDGDNAYIPTGLLVDDGVATVTYVTANTTTATTAVLATLASKEYVAG